MELSRLASVGEINSVIGDNREHTVHRESLMRSLLLAAAFAGAMPLLSKLMTVPPEKLAGEKRRDTQAAGRTRKVTYREIKRILIDTYKGMSDHGLSLLAAGVAFYAFFAIFPALAAATWIFGLLANPAEINSQLNNLRDVLPAEAWGLISKQLNTLTQKSSSFSLAGIVSLFVALYSARLAASSMMQALNTVYGLKEKRNFFVTNGLAILFTLVAIVILLVAVAALVVLPLLFGSIGLSSVWATAARYVRWPVLAVLMALALALVYRYGPDRENAHWKWLTWGSGTATVLWLGASLGFAWYVSAFNSYDKVYGSLGAVAILLFWFWMTAFAGLLGAELDNVIERRFGVPPTTDPDKDRAENKYSAARGGAGA
ncbi:MAG: YihY/virulence factor BrkB family protein [Rhodomicrobium sp.]